MIDGFIALYIFMLAAFCGYEVIARVPVILHTPLMSGSNFVHGIVLVGAMVAMGRAETPLEITIAFVGVVLAAGNAVGGYAVTGECSRCSRAARANADGHVRGHGGSGELLHRGRPVHPWLKRMGSPVTARGGIVRRRRNGRCHADHVPTPGQGASR
jgi:NAD(P) transhydrogenase subunit alpha